jgi:hypothetical protein
MVPAVATATNLGEPGARPHGLGRCGCESTAEDGVAFLKEEAEGLRQYLEGIERRISELQKTIE